VTVSSELLTSLLKGLVAETPVDLALVRAGLSSAHRASGDVALELGARHLLELAPELIERWFADPDRRGPIEHALQRDPLLVLESRRPELVGTSELGAGALAVERWFAPERVRRVLAAFGLGATQAPAGAAQLLRGFAGLHQLAAYSPLGSLGETERQPYALRWAERVAHRYPEQLAIVPSFRCGRNCAYCFSRAQLRDAPRDMSLEDFRRVLDTTAADGRISRVNFFGGEPTQFEALPSLLDELGRRGLRFYFSTNALCSSARFAELLAHPSLEMVTLHVDQRSTYTAEELEAFLANTRLLAQRRVQTVVRYNLTAEAERSWSLLEVVLRLLPRANFSFAVVFPAGDRRNAHVPLATLERFAPKIVALVRWVLERFPNIPRVVLSKPFPLCAFSDEELRLLVSRVDYRNICEIDRRSFADQVQVGPDLTATPCMAVTAEPYRLPALAPLEQLAHKFAPLLAPVMSKPMKPSCVHCSLFRSGHCQAACYAYAQ
jgi:pyruvate-formate lyase-activating enzyme